jgi:hypothetical protein
VQTPYTIVGSARTTNSNNSAVAYDGDTSTYWYIFSNSRPKSGYVWFDLGSQMPIGSINWIFAANNDPGFADGLVIEVSNDHVNWTTVASPGGAPVGVWQTHLTNVTARYVRFYFDNPAKAQRLGYLAEVKILP